MTVKLASSLPDGEANGLESIAGDLIRRPSSMRLVVALVDTKTLTTDMDTGAVVPTARVCRVEPITRSDDSRRPLLTAPRASSFARRSDWPAERQRMCRRGR